MDYFSQLLTTTAQNMVNRIGCVYYAGGRRRLACGQWRWRSHSTRRTHRAACRRRL